MRKNFRLLIVAAMLFGLAPLAIAQTSKATNAAAARSWAGFWREFTAAVNKRDVASLRKMMPNDFFDGGGGETPDQWLEFMNKNTRKGSWRDLQKSVARGTTAKGSWSNKGTPTRVTRDNGYYFEFRQGKRWYFAGVVGD